MKIYDYFLDLFRLLKTGLPQRNLFYRIKYSSWPIFFSLSYLINPKNKIRKLAEHNTHGESGKIWGSYRLWLDFVYKYIAIKDFTTCPAINSVSGPAASDLVMRPYSESMVRSTSVQIVAKHLSTVFSKPNLKSWEKYISTYAGLWEMLVTHLGEPRCEMIIELGGGAIGSNMLYLKEKYPEIKGVNFDLPEMCRIQELSIKSYSLIANKKIAIQQISDVDDLIKISRNVRFSILSNWAFTEMPLVLRTKFLELFINAEFIAIAANTEFEGIDNMIYLQQMAKDINYKSMHLPLPFIDMMGFQKKHRFHLIYKNK